MSQYLGRRYLQGPDSVLSGTSSPDGVLTAPKGTLFVNTTTGSVWLNTNGGTMWRIFGTSQSPWVSGRYYFCPNATTFGVAATLGVGTLRVIPFYVPNQITIATIGSEATVAGDSGSKIRLGVYADDGTGRPGNLVVDAGQIAGDSASGAQEITLGSTVLGPGPYWVGAVVQSVVTTQPTVRISTGGVIPCDAGTSIPSAGAAYWGFFRTGVTGALPATFVVEGQHSLAPRVFIKVA